MVPGKELSLIWMTALADVEFEVALRATIRVCAKRQWPPAVADIVAELNGESDAASAWDHAGALVSSMGLSGALGVLERTEGRSFRALRRIRHVVREQSAEASRRAFMRAWVLVEAEEPVVEQRPMLAEFVAPEDPEACMAQARDAVARANGAPKMPMASGVGRPIPNLLADKGRGPLRPDFGAALRNG